jgi:hypothetical protein
VTGVLYLPRLPQSQHYAWLCGGDWLKEQVAVCNSMTKKPDPLGPQPIVDAPYPKQLFREGFSQYGYIVRWRARREFLDKANAVIPHLVRSLLTDRVIELASVPVTVFERVDYPDHLTLVGRSVERLLFVRADGLFDGVDWNLWDPTDDTRLEQFSEREQRFIREYLGHSGIVDLWHARQVTPIEWPLPLWQVIRMYSFSESDGAMEAHWLRLASSAIWNHITTWSQRWKLDRDWICLVAVATIAAAAESMTQGQPIPTGFVMPHSWESWYANLIGKPGGPPTTRRPQRRTSRGDHMEWLIGRHFMGMTAATVASQHGVSQQTVDRETKKVAQMVGIDMHQSKVGRRPKVRARTVRVRRPAN